MGPNSAIAPGSKVQLGLTFLLCGTTASLCWFTFSLKDAIQAEMRQTYVTKELFGSETAAIRREFALQLAPVVRELSELQATVRSLPTGGDRR